MTRTPSSCAGKENDMGVVIDYDEGGIGAICPFRKEPCMTECMMMRPTGFGEPRCSFRVIADELVLISGDLRKLREEGEGDA